MRWTESSESIWYSDCVSSTGFYRIMEVDGFWELSELTDNKPYYKTLKIGFYPSVDSAKKRAESREIRKAKQGKI